MKLENLDTQYLGREFIYYKEISSTQDEIWKRINENTAKNGMLIFADIQTQSYGTHGRIWYTDEENNIAFSFLIEASSNIKKLDGMTTEIAEIFVQIFENRYNIKLNIKEPNDLYYNGKKLGGILCQTKLVGDEVKYIVVGIGINTNKTKFPSDIKDIATSIKKEFNIEVDNFNIVTDFCNLFEEKINKRIGENK
jgi:BirA family biotin operon repressor/biotin-[acetyl-CoA-carboxylase] ligase